LIAGDHEGGQRQPEGVEGGQGDLHLRLIGTAILAVAELEQPVGGDELLAAGGGHIEPHGRRPEVIDAQQAAGEGAFQGGPVVIIGQRPQDCSEAVVGQVEPVDGLAGALAQGGQVRHGPRLDLVEAVVALGEQMGEPERRGPAEAEPEPVAVDGTVPIQQLADPHALHLGQQQREVVDPLDGERGRRGHPSCLSQFPFPCPNPRTVGDHGSRQVVRRVLALTPHTTAADLRLEEEAAAAPTFLPTTPGRTASGQATPFPTLVRSTLPSISSSFDLI
jgi:hypothetical protein